MATHSSTLTWKIPWTEEPGRLQSMGSLRAGHDWATSLSLFTFMHWRRKWQPSVLAWRIPGTGEPGGLLSIGSHRVGHYWSDLAAAAAVINGMNKLLQVNNSMNEGNFLGKWWYRALNSPSAFDQKKLKHKIWMEKKGLRNLCLPDSGHTVWGVKRSRGGYVFAML